MTVYSGQASVVRFTRTLPMPVTSRSGASPQLRVSLQTKCEESGKG